jgi:hypothetical protein
MDKMTQSLLYKLLNSLMLQGYSVDFSGEDTMVTVQDSMGFRFEISVAPQGRTLRWAIKDDFDTGECK